MIALLFTPISAAQAETYEGSGFRHIDARCSWGQTWVTNEWGRPGLRSVATIDASVFGWCGRKDWSTQRTEHLAVRQELWAWDDVHQVEFLCNSGAWQYWWGTEGQRHDVWTQWAWNVPCISHWYRGRGFSGTYFGGGWRGAERAGIDTSGWVFV